MALLSPADQHRLRDSLAEMAHPVRLLLFTQTLDCETCPIARQIIGELSALSDKIAVDEVNVVLDADRAKQYGIDRAPAIAIISDAHDDDSAERGEDSRIRFLGAPSGYEFISLVHAVLLVGGRPASLSDRNRARVAAVDQPVTIQVFTTPT